jgi:hypothetical protein
MATRLSTQYQVVVFRPGIQDKRNRAKAPHRRKRLASFHVIETRKRDAITAARREALARGLGYDGEVYAIGGDDNAAIFQGGVVKSRTGRLVFQVRPL